MNARAGRPDILGWARLRARRGAQRAAPTVAAFATIATAVLLGGLAWNVQATVEADVLAGGSLAVVEVRADGAEARALTGSALDRLRATSGVAAVEPAIDGASMYAADGAWVLPIVAYQASQPPPGGAAPPAPGEFLAPARAQGVDFAERVGEEIPLEITTRTGPDEGTSEPRTLVLSGTYDPAWQVYGPGVALLAFDTALEIVAAREGASPEAYLDGVGVDSALVVADDPGAVSALAEQLRADGFAASPLADRLGRLPGVFAVLPYAVALAAGFGLIVLVTTVAASVAATVRGQVGELALLRVNGWGVADVRRLVAVEGVLSTIIGAVAGGLLAVIATPVISAGAIDLIGTATDVAALVWRPAVLALGAVVLSVGVGGVAAIAAAHRSLRTDPYLAIGREDA